MTDPMTTPPLDLPALRDDLRMSTGRTFPIYREELQALLDRLVNAESAWTNWQNVGLGMQARAEAAERDLAAVTVSRDGWQTRAEAAEKKVAAVRELHAHKHYDKYGRSHKEPQGHGAWCTFCGNAPDDYCATIKALDGTL